MEVFDVIKTVLAVREYQDKPVPPEVVRRILEAAWLTGSSMNRQPWLFILVDQSKELEKLANAVHTGPYVRQAPLAVAVAVEADSQFGISDGSRAIQSMILAAWAEGVGSNWTGFYGMDEVNRLLGIPETYKVLAVIPFGYPVKKIGLGHKKRKAFDEVVYHRKMGRPLTLD
jgi:nitroreductase